MKSMSIETRCSAWPIPPHHSRGRRLPPSKFPFSLNNARPTLLPSPSPNNDLLGKEHATQMLHSVNSSATGVHDTTYSCLYRRSGKEVDGYKIMHSVCWNRTLSPPSNGSTRAFPSQYIQNIQDKHTLRMHSMLDIAKARAGRSRSSLVWHRFYNVSDIPSDGHL